ncbi:MAG TPA: GNAT family N-acetyltransferase [Solirubrobacterales bacterium]|nr:GNAT family N-acetyltransferase [Solirubrobacterales bacterium]
MSDGSRTVPAAPPGSGPAAGARVRPASGEDATAVATAVEALLIELGGERPSATDLQAAARALAGDPRAGALLVAEHEGTIVGVLAASWQYAIHVPGRYGTIQDLWVHPEWRSRALGRKLIVALVRQAAEAGVPRLEVGLPQASFAQLPATERFYRENGFAPLGPRMRRLIS